MLKPVTARELIRGISDREARWLLQGEQRQRTGDLEGATRKYAKILKRNPRCYPARFSFAAIAHVLCEHEAAIAHLELLTRQVPGFTEAWFNLGTIQQCVGQYEAAETSLRQALALDPALVGAHINLGNALLGLGRTEEAMASFDNALRFNPKDADATWNLAHALVLRGEWVRGWECYEARWNIPGFVQLNAVTIEEGRSDEPLPWRGADLRGKSLIVVEEQGYGDTFMCLRYAPLLRARGALVTWAVRPEVVRLAERVVTPDRVVSVRDPVPGADYIVAAMTLHHRLGITPDTVPGADGYLEVA